MKHVLVLDRDQATRLELIELMGQHDMRVTPVSDSKHLLDVLSTDVVDALLIEIATDELVSVIRQLKAVTHAPILVVGAQKSVEEDKVRGLEAGASDYICKPVGIRELVARLRAAMRDRPTSVLRPERRSYTFSGYQLLIRQRLLTHSHAGEIKLTTAEFNLLTVFLASPRSVLTRERLLSASRLHEGEISDRSLDALILRLRRKVETDPANPRLIRTIRGTGYLFDSDVVSEIKGPAKSRP
ncbi:winged helix-turn-helix domain-containing protein [Rhizobium cauense]|uniref:winged helix-turn-helix domain-containing protein n=1 Tax=Rhizobium cauense TaxID=1166683 RepID=UPI001C6EC284|nr:winged helix-turn-helix domain-containing protein [Rhizobium cauense]MBW9113886.1 winged helix-turn-helix domain-containing protein [Rhizobium cauense]